MIACILRTETFMLKSDAKDSLMKRRLETAQETRLDDISDQHYRFCHIEVCRRFTLDVLLSVFELCSVFSA